MKKEEQKKTVAEGFPVTVEFKKARSTLTFVDKENLREWLGHEDKKMRELGGNIQALNINKRIVHDFLQKVDEENLINRLTAFANEYVPASAFQGLFDVIGGDSGLFNSICQIMTSQPPLQIQNNQIIVAQVAALFLRAYGAPQELVTSIHTLQKEASQAVADAKICARTLAETTEKTKKDLEVLESTYTNQLATTAPKKFWNKRAEDNRKQAGDAEKWWQGTLAALILIFLLLIVWSSFSGTIADTSTAGLISLARNILLYGSALSLVVWFSRTKLRDKRTHEHLATDAQERVTMIETYNVLKQAGLEGADLSNVLAALYRPVTDGLVDDSGPSLPMEIFIKQAANLQGR